MLVRVRRLCEHHELGALRVLALGDRDATSPAFRALEAMKRESRLLVAYGDPGGRRRWA